MSATDSHAHAGSKTGASPRWSAWLTRAVVAYLWLRVVNHLRVVWTVDAAYAYGWAVPFLCALLLWRRWRDAGTLKAETPEFSRVSLSAFQLFSILLFIGTRLIEEANPDWRFVSWALALEVIGVSLGFVFLSGGGGAMKQFAFPILFFLVAVPWPTVAEHPLIQILTRGIVVATVELLNLFGLPALPHGNVIETAGGLVDIDAACSGIRSLQAALMLALFFGEWHRLSVKRRLGLVALSFALAGAFNLARTVTLSLVAAKQGSAAVARWHDPAGVVILVGCFYGVWTVAEWLGRRDGRELKGRKGRHDKSGDPFRPLSSLPSLATASLAALLLAGELAVHLWYASAPRVATADWRAEFPLANPSFKASALPPAALQILRFNEGQSGAWQNGDGTRWQMIYLRWQPGRVASMLARNHTPEICLPAAGKNLRGISEVPRVEAAGVTLPFRCYATEQSGRPLFVFYSLWEDGAREQRVLTELLTWGARFDAVQARRRNPGQRVVEIGLWGARDQAHAEELLRAELPKLIRVSP